MLREELFEIRKQRFEITKEMVDKVKSLRNWHITPSVGYAYSISSHHDIKEMRKFYVGRRNDLSKYIRESEEKKSWIPLPCGSEWFEVRDKYAKDHIKEFRHLIIDKKSPVRRLVGSRYFNLCLPRMVDERILDKLRDEVEKVEDREVRDTLKDQLENADWIKDGYIIVAIYCSDKMNSNTSICISDTLPKYDLKSRYLSLVSDSVYTVYYDKDKEEFHTNIKQLDIIYNKKFQMTMLDWVDDQFNLQDWCRDYVKAEIDFDEIEKILSHYPDGIDLTGEELYRELLDYYDKRHVDHLVNIAYNNYS